MALLTGATIGAGLSAIGAIAGGIASRRARRRDRQELQSMRDQNRAWYDRNWNQDPLQRADAKNLIGTTEELLRKRSKSAEGSAKVAGASSERVAQERQAQNQVLGDTMSKIALDNERRKERIESTYKATDSALSQQTRALDREDAEQARGASMDLFNAGATIAGNLGSVDNKNKKDYI